MLMFAALFLSGVLAIGVGAQNGAPGGSQSAEPSTPSQPSAAQVSRQGVIVPAGTKVLLQLKSPIDTKSARVGDGVYCQTSFPVTEDNIVVIPAGTYVKGEIAHVERAGRIKGRAQILFHFNTMIFPNGYTVELPGALKNEPGATNSTVSEDEGTVKANGQKGKDAGTVATTGATGGVIGGVASGRAKGAGIGGLAGAAVGLGEVLFTRGQDVRIEQGTSLEMVLQRPLTVEVSHADPAEAADTGVRPRLTNSKKLSVPTRTPH